MTTLLCFTVRCDDRHYSATLLCFTVCCDDRRYCANGTLSINAVDEQNALMAARGEGWEITRYGDTAVCPACLNQQHPRRHP